MSWSFYATGTVPAVTARLREHTVHGETGQFETARTLILSQLSHLGTLERHPAPGVTLGAVVESSGHLDSHSGGGLQIKVHATWLHLHEDDSDAESSGDSAQDSAPAAPYAANE